MAGIHVNVAVISGDKILLTQRDDWQTWVLPGGGVEDGETRAQAAIRETKEETGLDVRLTRLVGLYSRIGSFSPSYKILFAAVPIGGEIRCQEGETIAVEWFDFNALPAPLSLGHRRRIQDAISGVHGVVVSQEIKVPDAPAALNRQLLMNACNRSGLSRQDFYVRMLQSSETRETVEVEGVCPGGISSVTGV